MSVPGLPLLEVQGPLLLWLFLDVHAARILSTEEPLVAVS